MITHKWQMFLLQLELEQNDTGSKTAKVALLHAKYFKRFASSPPFNDCCDRDTETLAKEMRRALTTLQCPQNLEKNAADEETRGTPTATPRNVDGFQDVDALSKEDEEGGREEESAETSQGATETPVSTKQLHKRKKRLTFSGEVPGPSKKQKNDDLQHSCEDCLVSGKQTFIP